MVASSILYQEPNGEWAKIATDLTNGVHTLRTQNLVNNSLGFGSSRPQLGMLGDSETEYCWTEASNKAGSESRSWVHWARILLRQAFDVQYSNVFAYPGQQTPYINANGLAPLLAAPVNWVTIFMGTNDPIASPVVPYATTIENIAAAVQANLSLGRAVVLMTLFPRAATSAQQSQLSRINQWIRNYARITAGVLLVDSEAVLVDPATGAMLAVCTDDGTHLSPTGAYRVGKLMATVLRPYVPVSPLFWSSPADLFDLTNNPLGNTILNPTFAGSGGSIGGTSGITGVAPTSWTLTATTAAGITAGTIVASQVPRADGLGNWLQFKLTGLKMPAGLGFYASQSLTTNLAQVPYVSFVEVEMDAGQTGIETITALVREQSPILDHVEMDTYPLFVMNDEAWSGVLAVPEFTPKVASTTLNTRLLISVNTAVATGAGVNATVRFSLPTFARKS